MEAIALKATGLVLESPGGNQQSVAGLEVPAGTLVLLATPAAAGLDQAVAAALGGLIPPAAGRIEIGGEPLTGLDEAARAALRRWRVGWVFPQPLLEPLLDGVENVLLPIRPLLWRRAMLAEYRQRALTLLRQLEATEAAHRPARSLEPALAWRVALARALVAAPRLLVAYRPGAATGDLPPDFPALVQAMIGEYGTGGLVVGDEEVWGPVAGQILRTGGQHGEQPNGRQENGGWV